MTTHLGNIVIDKDKVTADLTDFVLYLRMSDLPTDIHDELTSSAGNIRFFTGDGLTEIPRDLVTYDDTDDEGTVFVYCKGFTVSSSTDTTIQVHKDGVAADYAVGATNGRQATWNHSYLVVWHGTDKTTESTAGYTITETASAGTHVTTGGGFGEGIGYYYNSNTNNGLYVGVSPTTNNYPSTLQAWARPRDANWETKTIVGIGDPSFSTQRSDVRTRMDANNMRYNTAIAAGGSSSIVDGTFEAAWNGTWQKVNYVQTDATDRDVYENLETSGNPAMNISRTPTNIDRFGIGISADSSPYTQGDMDLCHARWRDEALSTNYTTTEYRNESDPGTFYSVTSVLASEPKIAVVRGALPVSSGTADYTVSGFGTPTAAIFIVSGGTVDDTLSTDAKFSFGATDGTRQMVVCGLDQDAQTTTNTTRGQSPNACVAFPGPFTVFEASWDFDSWITNGVRLVHSTGTAVARLVTVILIRGTSNVWVGELDDLGVGTSEIDIDFGVGNRFEPDLVFIGATGYNQSNQQTSTFLMSVGAAHNGTSISQASLTAVSLDGQGTSDAEIYLTGTYAATQIAGGTLDYGVEVTDFNANGFSVTPSVNAGADIIHYIALKFSTAASIKVGTMSWPTSGNYAETGPGFTPTWGMIATGFPVTALNTVTSDVGYSIATFDASSIFTTQVIIEDAVGTSDTASMSSDQMRVLDVDDNSELTASSYAFDSTGWSFTMSVNPAAAYRGWYIAIGDSVEDAGATPGPLHKIFYQYGDISAATLNGVLQS